MTPREFLQILRRSWGLAVIIVAGVVISTAVFTIRQTPVYEAATTLVMWPDKPLTEMNDVVDSLAALDRRVVVATYAKIPLSQTVIGLAQQQLRLSPDDMLQYPVRTAVIPDTNILRISVEGPNPRLVAELANAITQQTRHLVEESLGLFGLKPLDAATQPQRPVRPNIPRNLSVGVIVGLLLAVGVAFLREYIRHLKRPSSAQAETVQSLELDAIAAQER